MPMPGWALNEPGRIAEDAWRRHCPMSTRLVKFSGPDLDGSIEFTHPDVWHREDYPGWSRLLIGARQREIALILDLCREVEGPFVVLYVLAVSRVGHEEGRYQGPEVGYEDLELFLYTFQEFFEQDGRHHLWVISTRSDARFIFDKHNMVYAYGDLDRYEARLASAGFRPGSVSIPAPHAHHFHYQFDRAEDDLMAYWEWTRFPLVPEHD